MATISPPTIEDLGVQGCLSLGALLQAQQQRLPVAPSRRLTLSYMAQLRELGIIEIHCPRTPSEVAPAAELTPTEQIHWRFTWPTCVRAELPQAIEDFLTVVPRDEYWIACRARLWQQLAVAEAEAFLEAQLTKYNLEVNWVQDLVLVIQSAKLTLSIAQWRYCCWAAVRFAAAQAQRFQGEPHSRLRADMYAELTRRAGRLASGDWQGSAFTPFNPVPQSAAARLFTRALTRLGPAYWDAIPGEIEL